MDIKLQTNIVVFLVNKTTPYLIYLFGSAVKGTANENSDIDIVFLTEESFNEYETFMLAQEIANKINRDVYLINLQKATTVFQAQIVSTGKVIYCTSENKRMEYEMTTLKMYAKLNEERKIVVDTIQESGSVYNEE